MARTRAICPPGIWCLSPFTGFFGIIAILLFLFFIAYFLMNKPITATLPSEKQSTNIHVTQMSEGGDDRYTRAPQPQRFWNNGPEIPPRGALMPSDGRMFINVATQGLPEKYQQMGILKTSEGTVLPLYGRRVAARSDRYNYYTRTDTYNPVQLPVRYKNKDCQDTVGCQELFDGDDIKIEPTGQIAKATLYRFDGPLYVPSIL